MVKQEWRAVNSDYRFVEDEVRNYKVYKRQLVLAKNDIYFATPEMDANGGGRGNLPSSPTEMKALELIDSARIRHLAIWIHMIEDAYSELDEEKKRFVERYFWTERDVSLDVVAAEFNVSYSTANRWRSGFLHRVGTLTGARRTQTM